MKIHKYETKEQWLQMRTEVITSTEISALFNFNPYLTKFELWHQKKNKEIVLLEDDERMRWGNRLENPIAEGVAEDHSWMVHPFKDFATHDEIRAGSSFDYLVAIPNEDNTDTIEGLLEIKNVDWLQVRDKWLIENGEVIEAPPHIEIQVQHQMMITGHQFCYIAALQGGNKVHLLRRTPNQSIIDSIKTKIIKFWNSIDNGIEPSPNWEKDADFLARLHGHAEPGKIMNVTESRMDELAKEYKEISEVAKKAEDKKKAIKAEMLVLMGDSEKALGENYTVSAGVTGPSWVEAYERKGFRNFRIHFKKEKTK